MINRDQLWTGGQVSLMGAELNSASHLSSVNKSLLKVRRSVGLKSS